MTSIPQEGISSKNVDQANMVNLQTTMDFYGVNKKGDRSTISPSPSITPANSKRQLKQHDSFGFEHEGGEESPKVKAGQERRVKFDEPYKDSNEFPDDDEKKGEAKPVISHQINPEKGTTMEYMKSAITNLNQRVSNIDSKINKVETILEQQHVAIR